MVDFSPHAFQVTPPFPRSDFKNFPPLAMRTRRHNFFRGLTTGYVALAANLIYTMASVPLALHYLGREQFGLWALAQQISGYLMLLDLGMSASLSRLVANSKHQVDGGEYGSLLLTGAGVFFLQALLVFVLAFFFSRVAGSLFVIPPALEPAFRSAILILAGITSLSLLLRCLGIPLWAFQRMEIINQCMAANLLLGLLFLWLGFLWGWGFYSLAVAGLPGTLLTAAVSFWVCRRNGYYPSSRLAWGRPSRQTLRTSLVFGKDIFLIGLGSQLSNASQVMLISRWVGLDAAAVFSIATKGYTLAQQVGARIVQNAVSGLTDLYVSGQRERFARRIFHLFVLTALFACLAGSGLILSNREWIRLWTGSRVLFSAQGDILLGFMLLTTALSFSSIESFMAQGTLQRIRWVRFLEGVLIVGFSYLGARVLGLDGVLAATLLASFLSLALLLGRLGQTLPEIRGPAAVLLFKSVTVLGAAAAFSRLGEKMFPPFSPGTAIFWVGLAIVSCGWVVPADLRQELVSAFGSIWPKRKP